MSHASGPTYAIGVDYGTNSVRALVVETGAGEEVASALWPYAHGEDGVILDGADPNLARQHPADYPEGFVRAVAEAVRIASARPEFSPSRVVGLGIDTTGSTPLPVDRLGVALAMHEEFASDPGAMAWLWKDHTSHAEAAEITDRARAGGLPYLAKCGGTYSPEWFWSKALRFERAHPRLARAAAGWVEQCDYVAGFLTGRSDPATMPRSICAAGHKAMYHPSWGGLPSPEFLEALAPGLSRLRFSAPALPADRRAGGLLDSFAGRVGLPAGLPVAVGALDAHLGAVGSGVAPGTLVKIIGTSTCDCMVVPLDSALPDIPGVSGIVPESVVPGMIGIEAGQSAVGDIFHWFVQRIAPGAYGSGPGAHARLSEAAAALAPGQSGLVALDWHNGNRNVLADPLLTGLIVGQTLRTTPPEIYRALIEATAFGALKIIERITRHGVRIDRVINCGGIAERSPLTMQIYADVCDRPMLVARSGQACALGAAVFGAVVGGAHRDVPTAQAAMTGVRPRVYEPAPERASVYRRLYGLYSRLHDAFGVPGAGAPMHGVMKELLEIKRASSANA
ncbi:MAG TPA: ribulokinase [Phycisphaerales bacterium]|nr:ribulokinase [Phycisphaerales bacterium]